MLIGQRGYFIRSAGTYSVREKKLRLEIVFFLSITWFGNEGFRAQQKIRFLSIIWPGVGLMRSI